jgi:hypothetical protein
MEVSWMCLKLALLPAAALAVFAQTPCERLKSLALPHTTITAADSMPAQSATPAHCRVEATLQPSNDSDIKIEIRLPAAGWNGNYEAWEMEVGREPSTKPRWRWRWRAVTQPVPRTRATTARERVSRWDIRRS